MARAITRYEAHDGTVWPTFETAAAHEELVERVRVATLPLGTRPNSSRFSNGDLGYIQHTRESVHQTKRALYEIAKEKIASTIQYQKDTNGHDDEWLALNAHPSWMGRMMEGCDPLERAYSRLNCIDDGYREWGQPYFASHPQEAKGQHEYASPLTSVDVD